MSFLSQMIIEDDTMNVLSCSFSFQQGSDSTGKPSQRPKGGQITVVIESTNKTDFKFKEAYCLNYDEDFDAVNDNPLKTRIVISAKEVTVKDTTFINNWAGKV